LSAGERFKSPARASRRFSNISLKFGLTQSISCWWHGVFNFGYAEVKNFPPATLISTLQIFKEQHCNHWLQTQYMTSKY